MRARRAYRLALIATATVAVAGGVAAYGLGAFDGADLATVDQRFRIRGDQPPPEDLVFVKIDDETFNELGTKFPLPRVTHADVIGNIAADGAKTIAYDVQFTEPGPDPSRTTR